MRLKGKTALIAGAGRNTGRAISLAFAREGADLILIARELGDELNKVARECESMGVQTLPLLADVADPASVNDAVAQGLKRFGKVDVQVNVAAIRPHKEFWKYDYDEWHRVFAVNLHSTFYLAKALAPQMMERRSGSIVALGGRASLAASPSGSATATSKHGLYGLIKSLALELGPYGVRANLIALSGIETVRLRPQWYIDPGGDPNPPMLKDTPLGRFGTPEEVAKVALFLASDDSSYVTGDRICCAGGRIM